MDLYNIVDKESCTLELKGNDRETVLKELAEIASRNSHLEGIDSHLIYQKLLEREKQGSTGFGNGIAIPHARIKGMKDFLVFISTSKKGIAYEAIDKKKVQVFFLILGPEEKVNEHIKVLAALSRIIAHSKVIKEILLAKSKAAIYESFMRYASDQKAEIKEKQEKMKLLMVTLYVDEYLYNILEFFIESGIEGSTIVDSVGMGLYISNIPLFADFIGFLSENRNYSKTLFTLVPESKLDDIVKGIEEITGDLDKKEGAMIMALDVSFFKGSMKMV
ncbi:PTS sugar transporter subunit IIA [Candidatus Auribacterota bacterium]